MNVHELNVYKFNELSDKAKEYARDKYRENFDFSLCSDYVFEECKELFKLLGVSVDRFYYSGFSSQGDGACLPVQKDWSFYEDASTS